ncbi:MAG: NAD(P)-binding domain-containing protein [Ruminococcus sp.]|nr:NAD(P)-binding domain-containing protein [Ruminococcus sp.]
MKITILGCGRWGSFLAWHFNRLGHSVLLWGRSTSEKLKNLKTTRANAYLKLPDNILLSSILSDAIDFSDIILIAIQEQNLRELLQCIVSTNYLEKTFVLCMKGIEINTCKRLSEVAYEYFKDNAEVAIMVGPGQPTDIINGESTCFIVDANKKKVSEYIAKSLNSEYIRMQIGNDIVGNEIGAAVNKIIGIAGGILDGLNHSSLKGLLMVAGTNEIAKLIKSQGGNPKTAYGLSCLGDYQASLYSEHSNSVSFGKTIVNNKEFNSHVPGVYTAKAIQKLANKCEISFLLTISQIILKKERPTKLVDALLNYNWGIYYEND